MTKAVEALLDSFDRLSMREKTEAVAEILRRSVEIDVPALSDEELISSAESAFLALDAREALSGED